MRPSSGANAGFAPNYLVDPTTGDIDYSRSSWGRSSWGRPAPAMVAGWARSSWGCICTRGHHGNSNGSSRSSWGSATWLVKWNG